MRNPVLIATLCLTVGCANIGTKTHELAHQMCNAGEELCIVDMASGIIFPVGIVIGVCFLLIGYPIYWGSSLCCED
jgi:hypothetical protein